MTLHATPSQTVGPFFELGFAWLYADDLVGAEADSETITLYGRVWDGDMQPISDAVLEFWQADAAGRYPHPDDPNAGAVAPGFRGFGRVATGADGSFRLRTRKPGACRGQAPHLSVTVFMRGLLSAASTRVYFPDDPRNELDPVLRLVPAERRATLLAASEGPHLLRWDVCMQGDRETVFFDF